MMPTKMTNHLGDKDKQIAEAYINNQRRRARLKAIDECIQVLQELHGKTMGRHNYYAHAAQVVKRLKKL